MARDKGIYARVSLLIPQSSVIICIYENYIQQALWQCTELPSSTNEQLSIVYSLLLQQNYKRYNVLTWKMHMMTDDWGIKRPTRA